MAQRVDDIPTDARTAHETEVGLQVAWLVSLARAFRPQDGRELRRDPDVRSAQVGLIHALLRACADGTSLEELHTRFIDPILHETRAYREEDSLLTDTVRLVERHLACRA